jgi:hypothetical protein
MKETEKVNLNSVKMENIKTSILQGIVFGVVMGFFLCLQRWNNQRNNWWSY